MSEGAVHRELLAHLLPQTTSDVAVRDIVAALEKGRVGPLGLLYAASLEAGCAPAVARARAAGSYACFSAGNLADDLADGDCTYLERPTAVAPTLEFMLLHAAYSLWLGPGLVSPGRVVACADALVRGAAPQLVEIRTTRFDLDTTRELAAGMGGLQYAAYLQIAWDGTTLATRASEVGMALGCAGFVAEDRRTKDRRFFDLGAPEQQQLLDWARQHLRTVRGVALPSMEATLRYVEPLLAEDA